MAGGIDWFRWHHGSVSDQKFGLIAKKAGSSVAEVIAVWACLLELASAATTRGDPGAPDFEAMDNALGMEEGRSQRIYTHMLERDVIDKETGRVTSWEKRQPKREREDDHSTQRSREHRQRQAESSNATQRHATPEDANTNQETPRGEERREEVNTSTSLRSVESPPKRSSRKCPKAWEPSLEQWAWALREFPAVDSRLETAKLRDHTFKASIVDWDGAWRNWIRRAGEHPFSGGAPPLETAYQRSMRNRVAEFAPAVAARAPAKKPETPLAEVIDVTSRLLG